jgi:hypothetical protein
MAYKIVKELRGIIMKKLFIIGMIWIFNTNVFADASQAPSNSSSPPPNSPMAPTTVQTPLDDGTTFNNNQPSSNAINHGLSGTGNNSTNSGGTN